VVLLHLEVRDSVAKQAANAIVSLKNGNRVSGSGKLLRSCQSSRPGADHRYGFAGKSLRRMRFD
jgi:hypothetical protein